MLTQEDKGRQMEELQQKLSHAEGTRVKCELLCRWCTTVNVQIFVGTIFRELNFRGD